MDRDQARKIWSDSGLSYSDLTRPRINKLIELINHEMKRGGYIRGSFRADRSVKTKLVDNGFHIETTCRAYYFTKREAITFNDNGFISFAGWADDTNVEALLRPFVVWIEWMQSDCQAVAA